MRRLVLTLALLTAFGAPSLAHARPLNDPATGRPLSCPDPSVVDAGVGRYRYYLVCTSDFDANVFPIRGSNDLVHWRALGYVFPRGAQPWWALHSPNGRYWAPAIYRIKGQWVVYFAAQFDPAKVTLRYPGGAPIEPRTMVIGVASARSLFGPWHTRILHYRSQFNAVNREPETYGGVIDPSMVRDPRTGQLYLFWAEQHSSIWAGKLSSDGLTLDRHIHQVLWADGGWDCSPVSHGCVVEGPEEFYVNGRYYLLFSGASTWDGSYAVGVAVGSDPLSSVFARLGDGPILRSGPRWIGPGGSSHPIVGPDGRSYLFYHASLQPNPYHVSRYRYLMMSELTWDGALPIIGDGRAG